MPSDIIKMDVTLDAKRVLELVPGYTPRTVSDHQDLVDKVTDTMDLSSETGGWLWTVKETKPENGGGVRLTGRFVPVGTSVVA